jgi:serine/threonine protein kinase
MYPVSYATDIWSFGAVMFEVLFHQPMPTDPIGYDAIRNGTFDLSRIPEEFGIVRDMLNPNPNLRPTADHILQMNEVREALVVLEMEQDEPDALPFLEPECDVVRRASFGSLW